MGDDRPAARDDHWRHAGDRIEDLLDASSAGGPIARERAEQLVGELVELYGAGLHRIVELLADDAVRRLAADELVASLLIVHGLHPDDVPTRVRAALDSVRPYLGSHGGDVSLVRVEDGVVWLELSGSCRGCPSSSVTLELAVEEAVRAAAPEIERIEVVAAQTDSTAAVIPAESLFTRVHAAPAADWVAVPELAELRPGEVAGYEVAGQALLACRVGDNLLVYRDTCPACGGSLTGAQLHRRPGYPVGDAVLRCPSCRAHYDAVHAGDRLDGEGHLRPLPVLLRDGVPTVAVPALEPTA
ncbi:NifU family protein [Nocardia sp. CA-136227]|uniref:NifU family protein n=1 Tax=Nocardia sp. CA-136227 TaxID=3239979 RepID=UPI003D994460